MIAIKLKHDIILLEAKLVIKIHQISFFALTSTRPIDIIIAFDTLAGRNTNAIHQTPCLRVVRRVLVGKPYIVCLVNILSQHRL
ncbi:hypothetical protein AR158_c267L [Paramecium bursaria Chlorella virus AR158]|uniref:hypothetical protein n=1 Tax=Paramecium bursaria Chlorella virus AR158 TaxID=380598 RepID=UPI00015AA8DB|nr:hypothetical protein AR158_c267L [Paramecium bursaria Chlorella virus AR158]ABU43812.1 hypothetical protein AR158_c267L [Paramecium bursaria Chlorella virus AR158]